MTIALTLFYKGPVLKYYGVTPPDTIESLSIPAQHIARVIADDGTLSEKQEKLLSKAVDVSQIKKEYDPALSDPIKTLVRQTGNQEYIAEHKIDYFKLWIELGIEHPSTYLKAQIDQTKGYWYPDIQYWVTTTMMKENSWGMYRDSKMPGWIVVEYRILYVDNDSFGRGHNLQKKINCPIFPGCSNFTFVVYCNAGSGRISLQLCYDDYDSFIYNDCM